MESGKHRCSRVRGSTSILKLCNFADFPCLHHKIITESVITLIKEEKVCADKTICAAGADNSCPLTCYPSITSTTENASLQQSVNTSLLVLLNITHTSVISLFHMCLFGYAYVMLHCFSINASKIFCDHQHLCFKLAANLHCYETYGLKWWNEQMIP